MLAFFAWLHKSFICNLYIFPSLIKCVPHCLNSTEHKPLYAFCQEKKCAVLTFTNHLPALISPFIRFFDEKVRGEAQVHETWFHFVISVFQLFSRFIKILCFNDVACVYISLVIAFINIAVQTALAEFFAPVPRIPHRHISHLCFDFNIIGVYESTKINI